MNKLHGFKIAKNEIDLLTASINKIVSSEILEKEITEVLPKIDDLTDSNKIYQGKVSVLFVDMRCSSKLPEYFNNEQLVKIYRSYIRTLVQAIRYSGGEVRDFMGDGVLAVFSDGEYGKSEDNAVYAARYIATVVDKVLNPILDREINHRISCGIGIYTGEVTLSKVGMKGKKQDDASENEFGIAWIGNCTNMACKFCGVVNCETIFICASTFSNLSDLEGKKRWNKVEIEKEDNILSGYIAEKYYLDLDDDIEPCVATGFNLPFGLKESLIEEYKKHINAISEKAELLGKKEQELIEREKRLNTKLSDLNFKERDIYDSEKELNEDKYNFYIGVLRRAHCEREYIRKMGVDFWERYLKDAVEAGKIINKSEFEVKREISYAMVSIYESLEIYDKAYKFLIEQVKGYAWINVQTVKNIVSKVGVCECLKDALYERLGKDNIDPQYKNRFVEAKDWIVFEYKK